MPDKMSKLFFTKSAKQTQNAGRGLAKNILRKKTGKKAAILALKGNLGSGKTTFAQGMAKGLGIKEKITSPTFVIIKKFQVPGFKFQEFYHIDCYRVKNEKELIGLGIKEIINNPENIVVIEWSERAKKILPKSAVKINFEFIDEKTRKLMIKK